MGTNEKATNRGLPSFCGVLYSHHACLFQRGVYFFDFFNALDVVFIDVVLNGATDSCTLTL